MIWFFFFIINHSFMMKHMKTVLFEKVPWFLSYSFQCAFCFTFHISIILFMFSLVKAEYILIAPVINLFTELAYKRLINDR